MSSEWTTVEHIAARARRRWDDGTLLRAHANGEPFDPIDVSLRGPRPTEIGDDISAARAWVATLDAGRRGDAHYTLLWKSVGGRHIGRNSLPVRALISSYEQAWSLLNVSPSVRRFDDLLTLVQHHPPIRAWMIASPHRALAMAPRMPGLIAAYEWLDSNRQSGRYLREISAPGVDTKFAERYRSDLAGMLGVSASPATFLTDLGLRSKPALVRLRPAPSLGLPSALTELAIRSDELGRLDVRPRVALIIENEITYLSALVPPDGVVIWGKGFEVDNVGRLPWLSGVDVVYWGDIDTHGFAILDRLRAWLPAVRSVLMDRESLLAHRDRWVTEERPAVSNLSRLTPGERTLYIELVEGELGDGVRLEQERIDWAWAEQRLSVAMGLSTSRRM